MTMTNRTFYESIINGIVNDEIIDKAKDELAKLDARNTKRADAKAVKSAELDAPIKEAIMTAINGTMTTSEIASAVGLSTNKVSPRCKALVAEGKLVESEVKVKGSGNRKAYAKA